jgi:hypothetical protein
LEVATDAAFAERALLTDAVLPFRTTKSATAEYQTVRIDAENLRANTLYYYRLVIDGVQSAAQTVRTFPPVGVAAPVTLAIGSCNPSTDSANYPAFGAIAAAAPALFFHIGDIAYSNIKVDDVTLPRAQNVRAWKAGPVVGNMIKSVPAAYIFDNHDSGDSFKDLGTYAGTTWAKVLANSQQAYVETFPHYPLLVDGCLMQEIAIANVRVILLDCTSFREHDGKKPVTMLGAAQMAKLQERLLAAGTDGIDRVFIVMPERIEYWPVYPDARVLWDFLRDNAAALPELALVEGDVHFSGVDDGLWVDRTISGGKRQVVIPMIVASGLALAQMVPVTDVKPLAWNGAASTFYGKYHSFVLVDVEAGGDFTARIYAEPYSGTAGTLLRSYASRDLPNQATATAEDIAPALVST